MCADQVAPGTDGTAGAGLLATVVAALHESGWTLDVDWDREVFDVSPRDGQGSPLLGVAMTHNRSIVFYRVHPEYISVAARAAVAEFVLHQNTQLYTSAFELDLDTGNLSLRSGFAFPSLDLDLAVVQAIVGRLIDEVETVHERTQPELEAVLAHAHPAAEPTAPIITEDPA